MTLSGGPATPMLTEVPYGIPLRTLAARYGAPEAAGALMGGLFGGLVDARALDLPWSPERSPPPAPLWGAGPSTSSLPAAAR